MKKVVSGYLALVLISLLLFSGLRSYVFSDKFPQLLYKGENGVSYCARVQGTQFQLYNSKGGWSDSFLEGVDIGSGKPGYFPGELAITEDEYYRWFQQIAEMKANVIRIYIPQSPAFYKAFYKFNATALSPLYLMQGVYVNEEEVTIYQNVYADGSRLIDEFHKDILDAINIIHGRANIPAQRGKAYGSYTYDVSKYVIGWILGIEWNSDFVIGTNEANTGKTAFSGQYCYTRNASPFEVFLAETAELTVAYETEHYGMQRPVAFCNWPTTDPLEHADEPNKEREDIVTVDPEHLQATKAFAPGFFASYHVYPYYPDFMSYEKKYQVEGSNPYREYLKELTAYHTMPVLVSEFGLPTSRGKAHTNQVTGLNQGFLNEEEQGEGIASMLSDIHDTGCMGGIVFAWQDEWFKTTWNTMDFDDAKARPQWFNVMSGEENFGILTFDASEGVVVDGKTGDWNNTDIVVNNGSEQLSVKYDEAYLYLLAKVEDFENGRYIIPIDTLTGSGNHTFGSTSFSKDPDFLLVLSGRENSRLLIDPYYNPNYKLYGSVLFSADELSLYNTKNSGIFIDIEQVISRPLYLPQAHQSIGKEMFKAGRLQYGSADPSNDAFNSLSDFYESDGNVEIRIPWQMLNVADPSSCKVLSDLHKGPDLTFQTADSFNFGLGRAGAQAISMTAYQPTGWMTPTYSERLKKSYGILRESFGNYITPAGSASIQPDLITSIRQFYYRFDIITKELKLVSYLLGAALSILAYLFILLIIVNVNLNRKDRHKLREKEKLLAICNMSAADAMSHFNRKYICSPQGVDMVYELLNEIADWQIVRIKAILKKLGYARYLKKLLTSLNAQDVCLVIKIAAMLDFNEFEADIVNYMTHRSKDLNVQYNAFLALSLLGCRNSLIKLCKEKNYTLSLSYRCLKEIFSVYSGDKRDLYGQLLHSQDDYIKRVCIKVIGDEAYTEFEDELLLMLQTANVSLLCDVIRTLGQLKSKKAGEIINEFTSHNDWTIRNVAIAALGSIDMHLYIDAISTGLCDKEWWVRYTSAKAVCTYEHITQVQKGIEQTKDRFAGEMLAFAIAENELYQTKGVLRTNNPVR